MCGSQVCRETLRKKTIILCCTCEVNAFIPKILSQFASYAILFYSSLKDKTFPSKFDRRKITFLSNNTMCSLF